MCIKDNIQIEDEIEKGLTDDGKGLEVEESVDEEYVEEPLNPSLVRIETKPVLIESIITRIQKGEINLQQEFQRDVRIWSDKTQSRLIESLLIRIPIPAFYADASTNDSKWLIIDGIERINAIRRFVITNDLILSGLEFLTQFNNKSWNDLPRGFQRRLTETVLTFFIIEKGTPPDVKNVIIKRIKTGRLL
jgi:hypothetical protein